VITVKADTVELLNKLRAFPQVFSDFMEEQVRIEAKGGIRDAIQITAPGSTLTSKRRGEGTITTDVLTVFTPVVIKGYRTIKKVFGRTMKKPVRVKTVEKHPDVWAVYGQRLDRKQATGRKRIGRGRKQAYYADEKKLKAMTKKRHSGVGRLASGWLPAAQKVGVKVPAWIARHGAGRGTVKEDSRRMAYTFTAGNAVRYGRHAGIDRVVQGVKRMRQGKMHRRLPYALRAVLKKVNL